MQKDCKVVSKENKEPPVIAIRADGNENLGMGHLMRCMSIGRALEQQGAVCVFFVAQEETGSFVEEKGFTCEVLGTDYREMEKELTTLKALADNYAPGLWLVDSYQITREYLRALQRLAPVFYLDDTGEQVYEADGLINYNIYGDSLGYERNCPASMKLLLGANYAPVKEEFRKISFHVREDVQNVLITMGGSDKLNITGKLCQCLLERLPENVKLTLICGRFNPYLPKLLQLQEDEKRVRVLVDVPDMWNKMAEADVAVAAAGSTMYELSTIGVPTVSCYYVENQRRVAEGFAEKVGVCNAGNFAQEPEIVLQRMTEEVCRLVTAGEERMWLSRRMKQVTDGLGALRMAEALLQSREQHKL